MQLSIKAPRDVPGIDTLVTDVSYPGGPQALRQAVSRDQDEVLGEVLRSGLRGRGGPGPGDLTVLDDPVSMVRAAARVLKFSCSESCGKYTPCRESPYWLTEVLDRIEAGLGTIGDLSRLPDRADNVSGPCTVHFTAADHRPQNPVMALDWARCETPT